MVSKSTAAWNWRGVPKHATRDGWHWLKWLSSPNPAPQFWSAKRRCWLIDGEIISPGWVGPQTTYAGPVVPWSPDYQP